MHAERAETAAFQAISCALCASIGSARRPCEDGLRARSVSENPPLAFRSKLVRERQSASQSSTGERLRRYGPALLLLALGVAASSFAFSEAEQRARHDARLRFEKRATEISTSVALALKVALELLRSQLTLHEAFPELDSASFQRFSDSAAAHYPALVAVHWLPLVTHAERPRFEATTGIALRDALPDGTLACAAERALYLPVLYQGSWEPPARRGVDRLGPRGNPALRDARAGSSATAALIAPLEGGESADTDDPTLALAQAVHRHQRGLDPASDPVLGVVEIWVRLAPIVRSALARLDTTGLTIEIVDPSAPRSRQLVFRRGPGGVPEETRAAWRARAAGSDLRLADRFWRVLVLPDAEQAPGARPWGLLLGGLCASLLVATLVAIAGSVLHLRTRLEEAQQLGQYTLEEEIGRGSMGTVYRARHQLLKRPTAVKLLRVRNLDERALLRFEHEVQLTASLSHPNTIAIYDYGRTQDGVFYYAMEYLEGIDLQALVEADGPQPPGRVVHMLLQITGALAEAHGAGLIHRDVKPANLMLCVRGGVHDFMKVLDFGLVKDLRSPDALVKGSFVGTPLYAAPEAYLTPDRVDARADLYALGAVAFYLLTGREVFRGARVLEVLEQHVNAAPPTLREAGRADVPGALEEIVRACLAKHPGDRPASALALRAQLEALALEDTWRREHADAWWRERAPALVRRPPGLTRAQKTPEALSLEATQLASSL